MLPRDRCATNRCVTLPAEYDQLHKSGGLDAYRWDWPSGPDHPPIRSTMGDLPKWIEGAAHALGSDDDSSLMGQASDAIDRLVSGQESDGYLYSNRISLDERFANLRGWHELCDFLARRLLPAEPRPLHPADPRPHLLDRTTGAACPRVCEQSR